jgi:hypothetical protein
MSELEKWKERKQWIQTVFSNPEPNKVAVAPGGKGWDTQNTTCPSSTANNNVQTTRKTSSCIRGCKCLDRFLNTKYLLFSLFTYLCEITKRWEGGKASEGNDTRGDMTNLGIISLITHSRLFIHLQLKISIRSAYIFLLSCK